MYEGQTHVRLTSKSGLYSEMRSYTNIANRMIRACKTGTRKELLATARETRQLLDRVSSVCACRVLVAMLATLLYHSVVTFGGLRACYVHTCSLGGRCYRRTRTSSNSVTTNVAEFLVAKLRSCTVLEHGRPHRSRGASSHISTPKRQRIHAFVLIASACVRSKQTAALWHQVLC